MFFVSEEAPLPEAPHDPRNDVAFCLPPPRARPPPLPKVLRECSVRVLTTSLSGVMTLRPQGDEWVVTLDTAPVTDMPAMQVRGHEGKGTVNDLRWHGRAGLARPLRHVWKQKPGQA